MQSSQAAREISSSVPSLTGSFSFSPQAASKQQLMETQQQYRASIIMQLKIRGVLPQMQNDCENGDSFHYSKIKRT